MRDTVMDELRRTFKPEFLNRLDEIIVFHKLEDKHIAQIIDVLLGQFAKRASALDIHLTFTDALKEHIAKTGTNLHMVLDR
jgi:ATP-dependent Clp protease ATP-binding subunit ClpC